MNIPAALKSHKTWAKCYLDSDKKPTKRPIGGPKQEAKTSTSYRAIKEGAHPGQYLGVCLSSQDPLVCIDVDGLKQGFTFLDLPRSIQSLLIAEPTYSERSPSNKGLHIYYYTDKIPLQHRSAQDKGTRGFEGSVFIRDQFVTVTGNSFSLEAGIRTILPDVLEDMTLQDGQVVPIRNKQVLAQTQKLDVTLDQVENELMKLSSTLSDMPESIQAKIKTAYAGFVPPLTAVDDYTHWQYMASALHYAAARLGQEFEGAQIFIEWSAASSKFKSAKDAVDKFYACKPKFDGKDITHRTIYALARVLRPVWPYPLIVKGVATDQADMNNVHNWDTLFNYYDIKLERNVISKQYRFYAPPKIKNRYFQSEITGKNALETDVMYFAQGNIFIRSLAPQARAYARHLIKTKHLYNPIKDWIDSYTYDPKKEKSYFEELWQTLTLEETANHELCRSYLKKNLMGIIRGQYYEGVHAESTGIVIIQGAENTYKSTWVRQLLPSELSDKYIFASQTVPKKGAIKELQMEAAQCVIWLKDEIEVFFESNSEGELKNFLVQKSDDYRPLYATELVKTRRRCVFFGTTNRDKFRLSDHGNRRIQVIPVAHCNTRHDIDMGKVYAELLWEYNDTLARDRPKLWALNRIERLETDQVNTENWKVEREIDMFIKQIYDFKTRIGQIPMRTRDEDKALLIKSGDLIDQISQRIYLQYSRRPSRPAIKHSVRRVWQHWLKDIRFEAGLWKLKDGQCTYSSRSDKTILSGYLVPPLRNR